MEIAITNGSGFSGALTAAQPAIRHEILSVTGFGSLPDSLFVAPETLRMTIGGDVFEGVFTASHADHGAVRLTSIGKVEKA